MGGFWGAAGAGAGCSGYKLVGLEVVQLPAGVVGNPELLEVLG